MRPRPAGGHRGAEQGFTLVEVVLAMAIGVVVLMAATSLALSTSRSLAGLKLRDGIGRNARFLGLMLQRDVQEAGVGIESTPRFGTVAAFGDTLVILKVPYAPDESPPYTMVAAPLAPNPLALGGTCGMFCLDVRIADTTVPFALAPGKLARLQVAGERRLIVVTAASRVDSSGQLTFADLPGPLLQHETNYAGGLRLDKFNTFVQEVSAVVYWRNGTNLMRAERVDAGGALQGEVVGTGVQSFSVFLTFADGHEATFADGSDADPDNDYDDIRAVRVTAVLQADGTDPRVSGGVLLTRNYEWRITPRNLTYEHNRLY